MDRKVISGPSLEPLTVVQAKKYIRVTYANEDDLIASLIKTAREVVESYCNVVLIQQTIEERFNCFPVASNNNRYASMWLSASPLISVDSISYLDSDNQPQTLDASVYKVSGNHKPPYISLDHNQSWPSTAFVPGAVTVTYKAGYGTEASSVPDKYIQAMRLMIAEWDGDRTNSPRRFKTAAEKLLNQEIVYSFYEHR